VELSGQLIREITEEFPRFRIIKKDQNRFSRLIDIALRLVTLGGQNQYLTHYHTVIGNTLYVPLSWESASDVDRAILLRHERVHLRQRRRLGMVLMTFVYLVPFFPLGLAYGRARLEWEAYTETLRATAELCGLQAVRSSSLRDKIVERFTGSAYGWMWPFKSQVNRWYDRVISELEKC
jgi:hypothetical protein